MMDKYVTFCSNHDCPRSILVRWGNGALTRNLYLLIRKSSSVFNVYQTIVSIVLVNTLILGFFFITWKSEWPRVAHDELDFLL